MTRILILISLMLVHPAYGLAQDPASPIDAAQLAAFVDGAVAAAMRQNNIAGVSVAVVDRSQVVLANGYGVAALQPERAVEAGTLFRVGSISKTIEASPAPTAPVHTNSSSTCAPLRPAPASKQKMWPNA